MEISEILTKCDHTLLAQTATPEEIKKICDDGIKYSCASVCIPPCYVKFAKDYVLSRSSDLAVCTVIGFPNGYNSTSVKVFETLDAIKNGADEIDMVINLGMVKNSDYEGVKNEINEIKKACGDKILKVIIEVCFLTDDEIIALSKTVSESNADFIKTSTGFGSGGATFHSVELMKKYSSESLKIKAAGGISSIEDAEKFIALGASRLGTSRIVKIAKTLENK